MSGQEMYAHQDMTVRIGTSPHRMFLQDGFYNKSVISDKLHSHNYAEVHLVLGGDILYRIADGSHIAKDGSMLVIPAGVFHSGQMQSPEARHVAFQIDMPVDTFSHRAVSRGVLAELFSEVERAAATGDYTGIAALVMLLVRDLPTAQRISAEHISDYGFLIHEFFAHKYGEDVTLRDLAEALHLSERQAERLVHKHTGRSFREELSETRVQMARILLSDSDMTLTEIASYVGYRSYAGFWKAVKKKQIM